MFAGTILYMRPTNERRRYNETSSLIGWAHTQNDPCVWEWLHLSFWLTMVYMLNTLRPRQNGRHFADDTFNRIFVDENFSILIEISLNFVPKGPINNIPTLVQIMAWRRPGAKPLSEPMMVCLPTHICVTRPQWVNKRSRAIMLTFHSIFFLIPVLNFKLATLK